MLVAIASTDGENINEHFGRADRFFIFELNATGGSLLAVRPVQRLSTGDPNHAFDQSRMDTVLDALGDCKRIYCTKIGDRPKEELTKLGVEVKIASGRISDITP